MSDLAIRVEHLGKRYRIGGKKAPYKTLRDSLSTAVKAPVRWLKGERNRADNTFWALDDVSFEVKHGEAVGIIGRNGAGKSTLLKLLSRITKPTRGRVELYGRVGSLLEVGTGFHPELTGRENIYLNGAILGMSRRDIERKFDEIVDFAGMERFLDTAMKYYSSGMYVRLAFAVAAHLEPEILVVDEVLAVGDAQFQKKSLGKMGEVAMGGRTVLFVSHNMAAIQQLCQRGCVLQDGQLSFDGDIQEAIATYTRSLEILSSKNELASRLDRKGSQWLKFRKVALFDRENHEISRVLSGQDIKLRFYYTSEYEKRGATLVVSTTVFNDRGYLMSNLNSLDTGYTDLTVYREGYFECEWPKFNFRSGTYICGLFCSVNGEIVDWVQNAFTLSVEDGDFYETGQMLERNQGDILVPNSWKSSPTL